MTKRISHILLSLLLSVMIVTLSSGVTLVRCMHSGCVSMATLSDLSNDCAGDGNCMETTVLQLDNLTPAPSWSVDFHPTIQLTAVVNSLLFCWLQPATLADAPVPAIPLLKKGPPRAYLTLIRVLLI